MKQALDLLCITAPGLPWIAAALPGSSLWQSTACRSAKAGHAAY